ncbi:MAG TPA: hypothetical protein VFO34_17365, partial [Candidatus Acidoferrales bacterium]|nr:hypothetical protein [Candidatus Acidoferrales bacterium]
VSVLAPTGTIGFMMDCDTTGIEPDLALVKFKKLVGGGMIKIVNNTVPQALLHLGYSPEEMEKIVAHIDSAGTIEGAPALKPEHLPVFDCSLAPPDGGRSISWTGHLKMMSAGQPFLSGAISKTINMPEESTIEDVAQAYVDAWKLGLKAVAIYRNNSKRSQPLAAAGKKEDSQSAAPAAPAPVAAAQQELFTHTQRRRLPAERRSITHKFSIAGHEGYITVGMYEDNTPGEVFIKISKEGSTLSGVMDGFALTLSLALQYGVPLKSLVEKLQNTNFEPAGWTGNQAIPYAKSILDYIARWLGGHFISAEYLQSNVGMIQPAWPSGSLEAAAVSAPSAASSETISPSKAARQADSSRICATCGMLMTPNGSCYKCENCGGTSGCS